jgi:hypothetical protein
MREQGFYASVSKPDTGCISNEQLRTFLLFNTLVITLLIFWHIVIGMVYGKVTNKQ